MKGGLILLIINQCVEQGIYVVLILSLQKEHLPLRSTELSSILAVSDSYLKKILRKMVVRGIITSSPGKDGGFQLACPLEKVSVYDIYAALEGEEYDLKMTGIGGRIFIDDRRFTEGEQKVRNVFYKANEAFLDELRRLPLSDLVLKKNYEKGTLDFRAGKAEIK